MTTKPKSIKDLYPVPEWMCAHFPMFQNTGGNDVEELLHDTDTSMFANSIRYMLITSARSQHTLLMRLHEAGLLAAHEQEPVAKVDTVGVIWFADGNVCRKPPVGAELFSHPAPSIPASREPDAWQFKAVNGQWMDLMRDTVEKARADGYEVRGLWASDAAPSIPAAVPEEMSFAEACNFVQINNMATEDRVTLAMRAYNHCRAAMLQSEPQNAPQNIPVNIPAGAPERIWLNTSGEWPADGIESNVTWCRDQQHQDDVMYVRAELVSKPYKLPDGYVLVPIEPTE